MWCNNSVLCNRIACRSFPLNKAVKCFSWSCLQRGASDAFQLISLSECSQVSGWLEQQRRSFEAHLQPPPPSFLQVTCWQCVCPQGGRSLGEIVVEWVWGKSPSETGRVKENPAGVFVSWDHTANLQWAGMRNEWKPLGIHMNAALQTIKSISFFFRCVSNPPSDLGPVCHDREDAGIVNGLWLCCFSSLTKPRNFFHQPLKIVLAFPTIYYNFPRYYSGFHREDLLLLNVHTAAVFCVGGMSGKRTQNGPILGSNEGTITQDASNVRNVVYHQCRTK